MTIFCATERVNNSDWRLLKRKTEKIPQIYYWISCHWNISKKISENAKK
jgi:hypothetical protein